MSCSVNSATSEQKDGVFDLSNKLDCDSIFHLAIPTPFESKHSLCYFHRTFEATKCLLILALSEKNCQQG